MQNKQKFSIKFKNKMESKINVSLRIRPLSAAEAAQDKNHLWLKMSDSAIMNKRTKEVFQFDRVFGDEVTTRQIFDAQVHDIVHAAMDGIN